MRVIRDRRELTIILGGAIVALLTSLTSAVAGDPPPPGCQDLWYEYCVAAEENCIDDEYCEIFCENLGNCTVEYEFCGIDEQCKDKPNKVLSVCSCE
jgi:hypothetical protein